MDVTSAFEPRPIADEGAWNLVFPDLDLDVIVGGDDARPDPARVALAEWALERLDTLSARAHEYLEAFAHPARVHGAAWTMTGVEAGRFGGDRADEVHLVLVTDRDEGEWRVRFRRASISVEGFYAYGFSYIPI